MALGHARADVTEVYAEKNLEQARQDCEGDGVSRVKGSPSEEKDSQPGPRATRGQQIVLESKLHQLDDFIKSLEEFRHFWRFLLRTMAGTYCVDRTKFQSVSECVKHLAKKLQALPEVPRAPILTSILADLDLMNEEESRLLKASFSHAVEEANRHSDELSSRLYKHALACKSGGDKAQSESLFWKDIEAMREWWTIPANEFGKVLQYYEALIQRCHERRVQLIEFLSQPAAIETQPAA